MRRFFASAIVALLAAQIVGCASSPPQPAKPPPVDPETRFVPERLPSGRPARHEPAPRILAPPPAYGNKVVMAETTKVVRL